jgi:hypothetical protein
MRRAIGTGLGIGLAVLMAASAAFAQAATGSMAMTQETPYIGGRGLITDELATGMFLNPTSGTLRRYEFTLQYCALIFKVDHDTAVGHGAIAGFGLTDWLEIGAAGLLVDLPGDDPNPKVGGPMARVRLLKDEGWQPELSLGGIFLFGDQALEKKTVYIAASKGFKVSDTGPIRSVRAHAGFRNAWVEAGKDGHFGYVGGEIGLPKYVNVVAEVSNKSGGVDKIPWAAGIQVRHPDGFGFTLAAVQTGSVKALAVYVGVGINFQ